MTETAAQSHYVLPAATQFEKWEYTSFNFEFPTNYFHLRAPLIDSTPGTLPESEIYARVLRAMRLAHGARVRACARDCETRSKAIHE